MRFADILKMCFDSLSRRKGRTILTVLGVFIGCTSIIVMVSIGAGMQESYDQMLKNMGDLSIIEVYRGYNQSTGTQTESKLDDKAVESFHEIAGVQAVMPKASLDEYNVSFKAGVNGRYTANWVNFAGIDSSALEDMGFELMDGRYPESSDEVVVGQYFAYNFFDTLMPDGRNYVDRYIWDENGNIDTEKVPDPFFDPLKTSITMVLTPYDDGTGTEPTPYEVELKVVGVMKEDRGKGYETSDGVMMDINALKALIQDLTGTQTESKLDDKAVESFHEIAGVQAVMPKASLDEYNVSFKAGVNGRYTANWVNFAGIDSSALEDMGFELMDGRYPESSDEVVVGQYFAYNFFDTLMPDGRNYVDRYIWDENGNIDTEKVPDPFFDPLKTSITMVLTPYDDGTGTEPTPYEVELKVVGVMKEDRGKGYETSDGVMMDINALKALIQDLTGKTDTKFEYSSINVKAESLDAVSDVEQSIKDLGYSTYSMQSMRDELNKQTRQIELMLGGLGAISLLVAAIGITNTMIMSISERTKEIGIMKALGCYVRDIRAMFLMEAGSIGLLGGILGLIFSFIISVIINLFSFGAFGGGGVTWELIKQALIGGEGVVRTSVIKPELVIFALVFSVLVGLVSGYQPANKAVKISALEAIRNE